MRTVLPLLVLLPLPLTAQVDLTLRLGVADHSAHAQAPDAADHPAFSPGVARTMGAAVGYRFGGTRLAIGFRREAPDLVLRGDAAGVLTVGVLRSAAVVATVGRRFLGTATTPALDAEVGVARTRWSYDGYDDPPQSGWTGVAALEGTLPLAGRVHGVLRLEGGVGGSMFGEELLEGYQARTPRRLALELGLRLAP